MFLGDMGTMVVGRVYRITHRGVVAKHEGWLWLWEGEDDGDRRFPWPMLKSLATGKTAVIAPMWLEAADEV
jgi:hypothetical protein